MRKMWSAEYLTSYHPGPPRIETGFNFSGVDEKP
jgi:hypothetical protein